MYAYQASERIPVLSHEDGARCLTPHYVCNRDMLSQIQEAMATPVAMVTCTSCQVGHVQDSRKSGEQQGLNTM